MNWSVRDIAEAETWRILVYVINPVYLVLKVRYESIILVVLSLFMIWLSLVLYSDFKYKWGNSIVKDPHLIQCRLVGRGCGDFHTGVW